MSAGANRLNSAMRNLRVKWDLTESGWNDQVRRDFEENFIAVLESQVSATTRGMIQLQEVLIKVKRDLADPRE